MDIFNAQNSVNRRAALKILGAAAMGAAAGPLWSCSRLPTKKLLPGRGPLGPEFGMMSPMDRSIPIDQVSSKFSGDNPDRAHGILWDKAGFLAKSGPLPAIEAEVPLVIVGGGMSGIISAYLHREHFPLVLERAERFGGNSRGERWNGIDYSIGAAYFMQQDPGTPLYKMFKEAGIHQICRLKTTDDPVGLMGKRYDHFWAGETAPKAKKQFLLLGKHFKDMFDGTNGLKYPEMPCLTPEDRTLVETLDKITFHNYLKKVAGGNLHPHIHVLMEHYCWSTLGASLDDLSAACGLNAFAAEFGDVYVPPGGNGAVAEQFMKSALDVMPIKNFMTNCLVFDVTVEGDRSIVSYIDGEDKIHRVKAKAVIMACPKFVVKKILNGIEETRVQAIDSLNYNSYLVGNVLLNEKAKEEFYDLYLLGSGKLGKGGAKEWATEQKVTDVVLANYAMASADHTVLSLYRALPYKGSRGEVFQPEIFSKYKEEFRKQTIQEILPLLGLNQSSVFDVRIARWGHPIPVGAPNLISSGVIDRIRAPFQNRVFFVEQDNWMLPAIETCATEAYLCALDAKNALES